MPPLFSSSRRAGSTKPCATAVSRACASGATFDSCVETLSVSLPSSAIAAGVGELRDAAGRKSVLVDSYWTPLTDRVSAAEVPTKRRVLDALSDRDPQKT